jgi:hypothetical protein
MLKKCPKIVAEVLINHPLITPLYNYEKQDKIDFG